MKLELLSIREISQQLRNENDRSVAVIAASLLELQLEDLLLKAMIEHKDVQGLFQGYAPLTSLSAKASLAFFLGLIPSDIFNDLTYIRKIRNEFAHKHKAIDFSQQPVTDFVSHLIADKWLVKYTHLADEPIKTEEIEEISSKPRRAFEIAVAIVSINLDGYTGALQRPESKPACFPMLESVERTNDAIAEEA